MDSVQGLVGVDFGSISAATDNIPINLALFSSQRLLSIRDRTFVLNYSDLLQQVRKIKFP